jgi:hypothetical protein
MPLASMVRTFVSLVDVPDAISLGSAAFWTPPRSHNSQEFSGPLELTWGNRRSTAFFRVSCCGLSVSMGGYLLGGVY